MKKIINWFKQRRFNKKYILPVDRYDRMMADNTEKFLEAQEINYEINKRIAEIREWRPVGDEQTIVDEGLPVWKMSREHLITTVVHCYKTLNDLKKRYDNVCTSITDRAADEAADRMEQSLD